MIAKDTGYNEAGISSQRQEYWEKWNTWHIKNQNKLYKSTIMKTGENLTKKTN